VYNLDGGDARVQHAAGGIAGMFPIQHIHKGNLGTPDTRRGGTCWRSETAAAFVCTDLMRPKRRSSAANMPLVMRSASAWRSRSAASSAWKIVSSCFLTTCSVGFATHQQASARRHDWLHISRSSKHQGV